MEVFTIKNLECCGGVKHIFVIVPIFPKTKEIIDSSNGSKNQDTNGLNIQLLVEK